MRKMKIAGVLMSVVCLAGLSAQANDKLLKVLEDKQVISAAEAAEIKAAEPKYRVRPAGGAIKDMQIRGRIQAQAGYVDAKNDEGSDNYSTMELRRVRLGARATLFDNVRAQLEANMVPGSDFSMRSAFLQWREHKPAYIKLGYDKPYSSMEENTSSAQILTIERSLINSMVAAPGPLTGLALEGSLPVLQYGAGVYTDRKNTNPAGQDSKYMFNAMVGLKLHDLIDSKDTTMLIKGHYMKSDDPGGEVGGAFADDVMTVGAQLAKGPFDLRAEYFRGDNDGSKTTGWYIMPSAYVMDNLQLVARFEHAEADKAKGIRATSRYSRRVPSLKEREIKDADGNVLSKFDPQRGDEYNAVYVGLNYYFAKHLHKLMLGAEFAELKNTDAGKLESKTVYTAWRVLF